MHAFVVMPDHVHLLLSPLWDQKGERYSIAEIMAGIKGSSAHAINRELGRKGKVWETEYFDHVVRKDNFGAKFQYVVFNPAAAGLVNDPYKYPWLWINRDTEESALEGERATTSLV